MTPKERVTAVLNGILDTAHDDGQALPDRVFYALRDSMVDLVNKIIIEQQEYFASVQRRKSSFD